MSTGWSGWNQRWTDFPFPMSESGRLKKQSGVNVATLSSCGKDTAFVGIKWPVQWIYLSLFVNRGAICSWAQGLCFPERRAAGLRLPGCGLWIAGLRFVRDAFPRGAFWGDCRQRQQQFFELPSILLVVFCFVLYCRLLGDILFFCLYMLINQ